MFPDEHRCKVWHEIRQRANLNFDALQQHVTPAFDGDFGGGALRTFEDEIVDLGSGVAGVTLAKGFRFLNGDFGVFHDGAGMSSPKANRTASG